MSTFACWWSWGQQFNLILHFLILPFTVQLTTYSNIWFLLSSHFQLSTEFYNLIPVPKFGVYEPIKLLTVCLWRLSTEELSSFAPSPLLALHLFVLTKICFIILQYNINLLMKCTYILLLGGKMIDRSISQYEQHSHSLFIYSTRAFTGCRDSLGSDHYIKAWKRYCVQIQLFLVWLCLLLGMSDTCIGVLC